MDGGSLSMADLLATLVARARTLVAALLTGGAVAFGIASLLPPVFTARTTFLPPQQKSLSSAPLPAGSFAALVGGPDTLKVPEGVYFEMLQNDALADRIVERFDLLNAYGVSHREQARKALQDKVRIVAGKKDGMLSVEVEDTDRVRAAALANAFVDELQRLCLRMSTAQAQRRRALFEEQLARTRAKLADALQALQASGFDEQSLKAARLPAFEAQANLQAQIAAAEVRLQVLRQELADDADEVRSQSSGLAALREELSRLDAPARVGPASAYFTHYREYKYQEALLDVYARQFELARFEESRQQPLIQVIDRATPPDMKTRPRRLLVTVSAALLALLSTSAFILLRRHGRYPHRTPASAQ